MLIFLAIGLVGGWVTIATGGIGAAFLGHALTRFAIFAVTGVITGFAAGIEGMKVGGRRLLVVPPELGYGPDGSGDSISGTDTLVFVVDLVAVDTSSTMR